MGYFSCSRPPTSIAATQPYRPGGHMCSAPPWRSAGKGHGDTPAWCSLLSNTIRDIAKHRLCHSSWQAPPNIKKTEEEIDPTIVYPNQIKYDLQLVARTDGLLTGFLAPNKQIAFGLLRCGKLYWIDLRPKGPRRILLGQIYWGVISVGSNLGLFWHVRKSFYGPFPASCAISIDLSVHVHSAMQPPACCYWKDARPGQLLSLRYDIRLEPERHIEELNLYQVSLWRRQPCSTC